MKISLVLFFVFFSTASFAQTSLGPNSPLAASNTNCAFAYGSSVGYSPAANVMASDNSYATVIHCDCCDQNTQCFTLSDFGFAIPSGAVIDGIVMEMEKKRSAGSGGIIEDNGIKILKAGAIAGNDKRQAGVDWPLTDAYSTYGTSTDLWGTTWTPAEINDPGFGVAIASISYVCGATITTSIDHVRITVYYSTTTGIIEKAESTGSIVAFPNPVLSGNFITFSNIKKIEHLSITDISGKEIFNGSSNENKIALPSITNGVYFYRIQTNGNWYNGKLIVE